MLFVDPERSAPNLAPMLKTPRSQCHKQALPCPLQASASTSSAATRRSSVPGQKLKSCRPEGATCTNGLHTLSEEKIVRTERGSVGGVDIDREVGDAVAIHVALYKGEDVVVGIQY